MFKHIFPVCAVLLSLLMVVPAAAEMNPESGEMSVDNLNAVTGFLVSDQFLVSRLKLRKLDQDPVPELISIANDAKKKSFVRERAIKCMGLFRDKRVMVSFKDMLQSKPDQYFSVIVMSYLEAFGEDAVKDIKPFLDNKNADVRLTVVKGLGLFGGQSGFELLQEHDKKEANPQIQAEIRTYIQ